MNKEEIEELKDFTINLTDIDELTLGLEVCSKKSNMVIQEFADTIIQLQKENKKYKEVIDKAINNSQYWIDYYIRLNSDERIALRLQENIDILKEVE